MQLHVRWKNLEVSIPVRIHAQERVGQALEPFGQYVTAARIDLAQVTGQRGVDKVCRIQVRGARMCEIIVTDTDVDVYVAIQRAAERAAQCLTHVIDRAIAAQQEIAFEPASGERRSLDVDGREATQLVGGEAVQIAESISR